MERWAAKVLSISPESRQSVVDTTFQNHPDKMNTNVQKAYTILSSPFLRHSNTNNVPRALSSFHYVVEEKPPT